MSTKITKKKRPDLTLAERGMLWYLLDTRAPNGSVQRHYSVIAEETGVSTSHAFRFIESLIDKHYLKVLVASKRGRSGYPIPAIWEPIPPVERAYSTSGMSATPVIEKPIPPQNENARNGTGATRVNTGESPFQNSQKPVPDGTYLHNQSPISPTDCTQEQQSLCAPEPVEKNFSEPTFEEMQRARIAKAMAKRGARR